MLSVIVLTWYQLWPQLAHVKRPEWVVKKERDITRLLVDMAVAAPGADTWEMGVQVARRWKEEDAANPPPAEDATFFKNLVTVMENKARKRRLATNGEEDDDGESLTDVQRTSLVY